MKKIAVFIPVHNEAAYIEKTIQTIAAQDHADFDLIVSENHSTDGTANILLRLQADEPRLQIIRPPGKLNSYGNFCFAADFVNQRDYEASMMLGGHDLLSHNVLSSALRCLRDNPLCAIAYQRNSLEIDEADNVTRRWPICHESGHMNAPFDAILTLLTLMYNTPIFGLWRQSIRRAVSYRYPCVGGDHLYVAEAAAHGALIPVDGAQVYLRRAPPSADYLRKHFTSAEGADAAAKDTRVQLTWLNEIVDLAAAGHPEVSRELFRASATSLYFLRYSHHFATFHSTFEEFAAQPDTRAMLQQQINAGRAVTQWLSTSLPAKNTEGT